MHSILLAIVLLFGYVYRDFDNDKFPNKNDKKFVWFGGAPAGYISARSDGKWDCNDNNANINPSKPEICNGLDDDCINGADNGLPLITQFRDSDNDSEGINPAVTACSLQSGYVTNNRDPDDNNSLITSLTAPNPSAKGINVSMTSIPITLKTGLSFSNLNQVGRFETTPVLIVNLSAIKNAFTHTIVWNGSENRFAHPLDAFGNPGRGLNCSTDELNFWQKNSNLCDKKLGILNGGCCPTGSDYSIWNDYTYFLMVMGGDNFLVVPIAQAYAEYTMYGTQTRFQSEVQYMKAMIEATGAHITGVILGVESRIYISGDDYKNMVEANRIFLQSTFPGINFYGDANGSTAYDNAVRSITWIVGIREYLQWDLETYVEARATLYDRINADIAYALTFPGGHLYYAQTEFKTLSPMTNKITEGLFTVEKYVVIHNFRSAFIDGIAEFNAKHLVDNDGNVQPIYYAFMVLNEVHGYYGNSSLQNLSGDLPILAYTDGLVIVNPTSATYNIEQFAVDGLKKTPRTIITYYGTSLDATSFSTSNDSFIEGYSITKVTFNP